MLNKNTSKISCRLFCSAWHSGDRALNTAINHGCGHQVGAGDSEGRTKDSPVADSKGGTGRKKHPVCQGWMEGVGSNRR